MHLFFSDVQKIRKAGEISGFGPMELSGLLARWAPAAGTPIVLSESMTPVEPLCSWFRERSLDRRRTVIASLAAENAALRRQAANSATRSVIPLLRNAGVS